jgi:hypothetical protein
LLRLFIQEDVPAQRPEADRLKALEFLDDTYRRFFVRVRQDFVAQRVRILRVCMAWAKVWTTAGSRKSSLVVKVVATGILACLFGSLT